MGLSEANTFGFERRWVSLALRIIPESPGIFAPAQRDEAMDYFGIGNRKVDALAFWLRASGLAFMSKPGQLSLTTLGDIILRHDRSCDEDGTWWLLHSQLCRAQKEPGLKVSQTWHWYVHTFSWDSFTRADLKKALGESFPNNKPATIESAVNELMNALSSTPLGSLGLLVEIRPGRFHRREPDQDKLHPVVVGYNILTWAQDRRRSGQTVNLSELATQPEGPGRVFGLSVQSLSYYLTNLADRYGKSIFTYNTTAGLNSFALHAQNPNVLAEAYFLETVKGLPARQALERSTYVHTDHAR